MHRRLYQALRRLMVMSAVVIAGICGFTSASAQTSPKPYFSVTLPGTAHRYSSPVLAQLIPGNSEKQIVVVSGATLYALNVAGAVIWSYPLPNINCAASDTSNKVYATPAVGDLLHNGKSVVVAAYGGFGGTACGGGVIAIDGASGAKLWHYDLKVASKRLKFGTRVHSVFSSPTLADLDGDGTLEVAFGSWDRNVYVLDAHGKLRWYYLAADTVWSSPAVADVDGQGSMELLIGTDISKNPHLRPPTFDGGFLYAFKGKQKSRKVGFRDGSAYLWQSYADQVFYASPVVGDLIPVSPGPEIAIASGCFFPQHADQKRGRTLKVYNGRTGQLVKSLDIPACSSSQPAIADVNGDGLADLIFPASGDAGVPGTLFAWTPAADRLLWSVAPTPRGRNDSALGEFSSAVVADLDGNGSLEVVVNGGAGLSIFEGSSGLALTCNTPGCSDGLPYFDLGGTLHTTPAIADLNGDGASELIAVSGGAGNRTMVSGWTQMSQLIKSQPATTVAANAVIWSQFRGNAGHAACQGAFCPR